MLPKIIKPSVTRNQTMCSFTEDNKCKFLFILIRTVHIGIISKNFYFIFLIIIKKVLLHLHTYYNFFKINFKTFSFELAI